MRRDVQDVLDILNARQRTQTWYVWDSFMSWFDSAELNVKTLKDGSVRVTLSLENYKSRVTAPGLSSALTNAVCELYEQAHESIDAWLDHISVEG